MLIVAHRGGSPDNTHNSAAAFSHGMGVGADLLECDLQLTSSGDIVLYHDTEIFGAPVSGFSTDELRVLVSGLITIDEFLIFLRDNGPDMRLVLDLKSRDVDRSLIPYLEDRALRRRVLVTSTFSIGLLRLKRRFPDLRTGLSRGATFTRVPSRLLPIASATVGRIMVALALVQMAACRIDTVALQHELVDAGSIRLFHSRGRRVNVWTVDSSKRMQDLRRLGVDYLTTNMASEMTSLQRC